MRTCVLVIALLGAQSALAQTCLLDGGKFFCGTQVPSHYTVTACDEAGTFTYRLQAWCDARGGTWTGGDCVGGTPDDDGNVVQHSIAFANIVRGSTCSVTNDTGYGATYETNFCLPGGDFYSYGYLWRTARRLTISCENGTAETISIDKRRSLDCPAGYPQLFSATTGWTCGQPQDCDGCPGKKGEGKPGALGNPIAPLTGLKFETAVDYAMPRASSSCATTTRSASTSRRRAPRGATRRTASASCGARSSTNASCRSSLHTRSTSTQSACRQGRRSISI